MPTPAQQSLELFRGDNLSVRMFGGIGDGQIISDGVTSGFTPSLTSPSNPFTPNNAAPGMLIAVVGAGFGGSTLFTTVAAYVGPGQIELSAAATTLVSGAQVIWGTDNAAALAAAFSVTSNPQLAAVNLPSGVYCVSAGFTMQSGSSLLGRGRGSSSIAYLAASGNCVTMTSATGVLMRDLSLLAPNGPNVSIGLYQYNVRQVHTNIAISGFSVCHQVTGNDTTDTSEDVWLLEPDYTLFQSVGLALDHVTDLHLVHAHIRTANNNPLGAMGVIVDTASSGIYFDNASLEFCGAKIQSTMPSVNAAGYPPQFLFWSKVLADSMPTVGIHLDASLATADGLGRIAKSLHFFDCWAAGSTNVADGIRIEGGQDIVFTNPRVRNNQGNGIHITNGTQIRIVNPYTVGANIANTYGANSAGVCIEGASTGPVEILSGISGDNVSGDGGGHQAWGVYIASTYASAHQIIALQYSGNASGNLSDNGNGLATILGCVDYANGPQDNKLYMTSGRLEIGDGLFYLDYKNDSAGNVSISFDAQDFIRFYRSTDSLQIFMNNSSLLRFLLSASTKSLEIQNRPVDLTGINEVLISSAIDTDTADRFNLSGAGKMLWSSDGATITAQFYMVSAGLLELIGHLGINVSPTAQLHLSSGTATAGTGPLKLTAGVVTTTPEDGLIEYDGGNLFFTIGSTRFTINRFSIPVPVADGGTGQTSLTAHGVVIGEGTAGVNITTPGSSGQVLTSNGASADPTFQTATYGSLENLEGDASGSLTCTTSFADIPGATITLDKTGEYLIVGDFDLALDVTSTEIYGQLVIGGSAYGQQVTFTNSSSASVSNMGVVTSKVWLYSNSGSNIAKLQGKKFGGSGTATVNQTNTSIKAIFLG